jgi:hypothetical protein
MLCINRIQKKPSNRELFIAVQKQNHEKKKFQFDSGTRIITFAARNPSLPSLKT